VTKNQAQMEANHRYRQTEAGKAKQTYNNYRTWSRTFLNKYATEEDIQMIIELAKKRLEEINQRRKRNESNE
jgi:hypothetical protein